ncbi:MAG TPA: hypothetical protein VH637_00675 [Streptosporangiaceae bacterium]|jgi:hypothetical protein
MPLFGRKREPEEWAGPTVTGLAEHAASQGWDQLPARPFDGYLEDAVHEVARVLYHGRPPFTYFRPGRSSFQDAWGGTADGMRFAVANAWTSISDDLKPMSVCALEIPAPLNILQIRPASYPPFGFGWPVPVNPGFDSQFTVLARDGNAALAVLTPEVRELIAASGDWIFLAERQRFACLTLTPFGSADEVVARVGQVRAIYAAIPAAAPRP